MKNFDEMLAQDREFTVGGETFHWRDVRPEVLSEIEEMVNVGGDLTGVWEMVDKRILAFIPPDEHERWKILRARDENPVTVAQLGAIFSWLWEAQTSRPLEIASLSAPGPGKTAATSKAA